LDVFQEVKDNFIPLRKYYSLRVLWIVTDFLARYEGTSSSVSTAWRYWNCIYDVSERKQARAEKKFIIKV
jgi:hypothetical protein